MKINWLIIYASLFLCIIACGRNKSIDFSSIDALTDSAYNIIETDSFIRAKKLSDKALQLSVTAGYTKGISDAYSRLGLYYNKIGQYDSSLNYMLQALEVRKKIGDPKLLAYAYTNAAVQANNLNQYASVKRFLDSANYYSIKIQDTAQLIQLLKQTAIYYKDIKRLDSAKFLFNKQLLLVKIFKDSLEMSGSYLNLGNIVSELKQLNLARKYFDSGEKLAIKFADKNTLFDLMIGKAAIEVDLGNFDLAANQYEIASKLSDSGYGNFKGINSISMGKYLTAFKLGKYKEAAEYAIKYSQTNDSIVSSRNATLLADAEIKYRTAEKDAANRLLTAQNSRKTWIANSLIAGMVLLAGLGLILYRNFKQKQKIAQQTIILKSNEINELLNQQELEIFDAALRGQDEERNRIARELHDRLGGLLSITKLNFTSVEKDLKQIELKNRENFEQVNANLSEAMDELRRISHDLYAGSVINFGIVTALHQLCAAVEKSSHITVKFQALKVPSNLLQSTQIELYRVTQELLQNSLKHANANRIDISILISENNLVLNYEDNGNGFDTTTEWKKGMGFQNIETRIRKLSGSWNIDSSPGKGIFFSAEMPLLSNIIQDT